MHLLLTFMFLRGGTRAGLSVNGLVQHLLVVGKGQASPFLTYRLGRNLRFVFAAHFGTIAKTTLAFQCECQ